MPQPPATLPSVRTISPWRPLVWLVYGWRDMTQALQTGEAPALVREGEALLEAMDALTHRWERSLQMLLG